jgi:DNA invertase Pin-like site-specific DNA recombinase
MNIILLKNKNDETNITLQQKQILKYAHHHSIKVDTTEIENSHCDVILEERKEFKGFLRSIDDGSNLIIFDLFTFSKNIEELIKIFECLLTRSIAIHVVDLNVIIDVDSKPLVLLQLFSKQKELSENIEKEKTQGRPKGRMSKSKFDIYRPKVIALLENRTSISEIAKILGISRTSLKDYVNSRGLKDLVKVKISLLKAPKTKPPLATPSAPEECSLIQIEGTNP